MEMETKRLQERVGDQHIEDHSTTAVQAIFRDRREPLHEQIRTKGSYAIAAIAGAVVAMAVLGYAVGGGFSSGEPGVRGAASQDAFIAEQAELLHQQSIDLQEAQGELAVTQGEATFLRSRLSELTAEAERLQGSLNEARLEMQIIIGIYEECLDRLYPTQCIEAARPSAEAFLAELYAETP